MHGFFHSLTLTLTAILLTFALSGCALWDRFFGEKEPPLNELVEEANADFHKGNFVEAAEAYQKIKDRYPYSKYALESELKMADAYYNQEKYNEAFDAYSEFEKLHPTNPSTAYVMYQKGMCHFKQITAKDRDPAHTLKAKEEFEKLVKKYRKGEYVDRAQRRIRECYIYLADYELYVGNFYFKAGKYKTAAQRYRYLIETYPDYGQYHEALEYLAQCNEKIALEEAQPQGKKEQSWWRKLIPPRLK